MAYKPKQIFLIDIIISSKLAAPSLLAPPDQDVNLLGQLVDDMGKPLRRHLITGYIIDTDYVIGLF